MKKLVDDIAALTTVSTNALVHLQDKLTLCIGHCVYESKLEKESLTEIDIGIGILYIKYEEDKILYKFVPSKKLEESVSTAIFLNESPLVSRAEESLARRIDSVYKNLI